MLATVFTKSLRDRWLSTAIGAFTLGAFLLLGLATYQQIDLGIYNDLPEAFRTLIGIPDGADATTLAFSAIYGSYGALTLAGIAISLGSGSIAGEERDGTLGLLLGYPRSRTSVLASKAAAMVTLTAAGSLLLLAAGYVTPAVVGVELGGSHVTALVAHMFINSLFYGFLALAVGAWTGKRALASGVTAGVMILSFIGTGLLPFSERLKDGVKLLPWHYYAGSDPFLNGLDAGHLLVLVAGVVLFSAAAWVGVNRRDLRSGNVGASLIDRARALPQVEQLLGRLTGTARVSRIWIKTASEHQGLLVIVAIVMFGMMGVLMGVMFSAIEGTLASMSQLPDVVLAIAGGGDMSTPEGWYQLETFGLMAPGAVMMLGIVIGSRALAGEEQDNTMGLLLANPVRRSTVVLQKTLSVLLHSTLVGLATFAGVAVGSSVSGLGMDIGNIAATSLLATLLGLVFGTLALALGAATGRTRVATFGTIGIALLAYLMSNMLPLADSLAGFARWSPFHYYLSSDPLVNGMHWGHGALLLGLATALAALSVWLFDRRDLRS